MDSIAKYARYIALAGALIMLLLVFLPVSTASPEFAELLDEASGVPLEGYTAQDLKSLSMVEWSQCGGELIDEESGVILAVMMWIFLIPAIFNAIMALCKLPIGSIIFTVLSSMACLINFGLFGVLHEEETRGLYQFGFGFFVFVIGAIVCMVGSIMVLQEKSKAKKAAMQMNYQAPYGQPVYGQQPTYPTNNQPGNENM